jgi:hypothetical protein
MFIHQRKIVIFILLITIIKNTNSSSFTGRNAFVKRKETYQKRNEKFNDKALERQFILKLLSNL